MRSIQEMKLTIFALRRARTVLAESSAHETADVTRLIDKKIQSLKSRIERGAEVIP